MEPKSAWKWIVLAVFVFLSAILVWPPREKVRLGLDLEGGSSFVVAIDESEVVRETKDKLPEGATEKEIQKAVSKSLKSARDRALEIIRNRVDQLGISEPVIYPEKGSNRIIIQLPGADPRKQEEAEIQIQQVAFLAFHLVHKQNDELVLDMLSRGVVPDGYEMVSVGDERYYRRITGMEEDENNDKDLFKGMEAPLGYDYFLARRNIEGVEQRLYRPIVLKKRYELTGNNLNDAKVDVSAMTGSRTVILDFSREGAQEFERVTGNNVERKLAIVLDGVVYSAPVIEEKISHGSAQIRGSFSPPEANRLSMVLKTGSLPAPVEIIEKRKVDPLLGQDSINSGITSVLMAGVAVLVFMALYYLVSGLVADVALILNLLLLPLGMVLASGFLGTIIGTRTGGNPFVLPVLTLPGIAGILLTIGMAVDANVLIFERMREEFRSGKKLWSAITSGYDRAFVTIMDANVTTLITGAILFMFGSGPIRGFAVTLCAGIMVSLFTALVVTRLIFSLVAAKTNMRSLKMLSLLRETSIDFVGKRKLAVVLSVVLVVGPISYMTYRGMQDPSSIFGIDFVSGASVSLKYQTGPDVSEIRDVLDSGAQIQYQEETRGNKKYLVIKSATQESDAIVTSLKTAFPEAGLSVVREEQVEPQVSNVLKGRAIKAIIIALICIVIYISVRFEFGFAIGAIVALIHDVLITAGLYALFGRQMSLPIVAALLTIVGYSVNDTIVVFDRIREDLRLTSGKSFKDICNLSINQTLSRTVLTSLTTLLAIVMLLVFGGGAINDFALALLIGVLVGTYSSVFVATPIVLLWYRGRKPAFAAGQ